LRDEAENYFVPEPRELGLNGSFAVFKMIKTDVVKFENYLQSNKDKIDPELLAAKICGRWRNGVPLMLSPKTDSPSGGIPPEQLNNFEYVNADGSGDPKGLRCPVGAHMRRINPRGQPVTGQGQPGGSNNTHRLIRRGLPYATPTSGWKTRVSSGKRPKRRSTRLRGLRSYAIRSFCRKRAKQCISTSQETRRLTARLLGASIALAGLRKLQAGKRERKQPDDKWI
jgi:deferrochelatase/peroxidase EfeB